MGGCDEDRGYINSVSPQRNIQKIILPNRDPLAGQKKIIAKMEVLVPLSDVKELKARQDVLEGRFNALELDFAKVKFRVEKNTKKIYGRDYKDKVRG